MRVDITSAVTMATVTTATATDSAWTTDMAITVMVDMVMATMVTVGTVMLDTDMVDTDTEGTGMAVMVMGTLATVTVMGITKMQAKESFPEKMECPITRVVTICLQLGLLADRARAVRTAGNSASGRKWAGSDLLVLLMDDFHQLLIKRKTVRIDPERDRIVMRDTL